MTETTDGPAAWRALAEDVVRYGGFAEFDARMLLLWAAWARGHGDEALTAALRERPRNTAGDIFEAGATALRHVVRMAAALRAAADVVERVERERDALRAALASIAAHRDPLVSPAGALAYVQGIAQGVLAAPAVPAGEVLDALPDGTPLRWRDADGEERETTR
jgi:hypothetical protein